MTQLVKKGEGEAMKDLLLAPLSVFLTGSLSAVIYELSDAVWAANASPLAALGLKMNRCVLPGELMLKDSK